MYAFVAGVSTKSWNPEELKKLIVGSNSTPYRLAVGRGIII
jgi:hypothetical protein